MVSTTAAELWLTRWHCQLNWWSLPIGWLLSITAVVNTTGMTHVGTKCSWAADADTPFLQEHILSLTELFLHINKNGIVLHLKVAAQWTFRPGSSSNRTLQTGAVVSSHRKKVLSLNIPTTSSVHGWGFLHSIKPHACLVNCPRLIWCYDGSRSHDLELR